MNSNVANIESKIEKFTQQRESEWLVLCGLKTVPYNEMLKILQLLRDEELYELEAMMIWKMEYWELNGTKEKGEESE